jgi:hypothetical protein
MSPVLPLLAIALAVAVAAAWARRERQLTVVALAALEERLRELSMRVEVAEHDSIEASEHAEIAESVLLEKGYADPDDLEAARHRLDRQSGGVARGREGEIH